MLFDVLRKKIVRSIKQWRREMQEAEAKSAFLCALAEQAEWKPVLLDYRPDNWVVVGERMVCFVGGWEGRTIEGRWVFGRVVNNPECHNGFVAILCDKRVHDGAYLGGRGIMYEVSRPEVLTEEEYGYLREHSDFASLWLADVFRHRNSGFVGLNQMFEALAD